MPHWSKVKKESVDRQNSSGEKSNSTFIMTSIQRLYKLGTKKGRAILFIDNDNRMHLIHCY